MANNMKSFSFARQNNNLNLWMIGVNASNDGQLSTNITTEGIVSYTKLVSFLESDKTANTITVNSVNSSTFYSSAMPDIVCLALTRTGYSIEPTTLTNIGNAIRTKLNGNTKYKPSQMPNAILSIPSAQIDYPATSSRQYWFFNGYNLNNQPLWDIVKNTAPYSSDSANDYMFKQSITDASKNQLYQAQNWGIDFLGEEMFYGCTYLSDFQVSNNILTASISMNWKSPFYNCQRVKLSKVIALYESLEDAGKLSTINTANMFYGIGRYETTDIIPDCTFTSILPTGEYFFGENGAKKFGNITFTQSGTMNAASCFKFPYAEEVGMITFSNATISNVRWLAAFSNNLVKFGGLSVPNQTSSMMGSYQNTKFLDFKECTKLEEVLNLPISYWTSGMKCAYMYLSSEGNKLRRLTCNTTNIPYVNKTADKSFSIAYCSFDRAGMVEMFNSLPDANDVTGAKNITITGNPCVTDGTLTAADMAIATNKGYTLTT
jgi:hypothetical protein